jgi:hypothetical protein
MHFHFNVPRQLARKVFDVDAGSAVDGGWILAGHDAYTHGG